MSHLDSLHYFFRLCQFSGFLPFRMEMDQTTARLKTFSFSLRHPVMWWYLTGCFTSVIIFVLLLDELFVTPEIQRLPPVIKITTKTVVILYYILFMSVRYWLIFRFQTLCGAFAFIRKVETQQRTVYQDCKSTLRFRAAFSIVFSFSTVRICVCRTIIFVPTIPDSRIQLFDYFSKLSSYLWDSTF